jgi:hypothetical protein
MEGKNSKGEIRMTKTEFYEIIKKYAHDQMFDEGKKSAETTGLESAMHQGASNEAAKFYQFIDMAWIEE